MAALLPEPMLLVSGDGLVLAANRAAAELLGHPSAGNLVDRRLPDLVDQDVATVEEWLRASSRSRKLIPGSLGFRRGNGTSIHCRADGAVYSPASAGEVAAVLVRLTPRREAVDPFLDLNLRIEELKTEVGRRKQAELALYHERERLRVTLESIGDAVIATDIGGRITFLNRVAEALTGWEGEEALGRPLGEVFVIINEGTRAPIESPVDKVLRLGTVVPLANHTLLIHRNGSETSIDDTAAPIRDEGKGMKGVVLVFHEITERRELERQLRQADERKDEFLAMLAHELRNPLAPLRTGIEVLRKGTNAPGQFDRVSEMMDRQVRHMTRLVDELLDVSRITRGRVDLRREPVDLIPTLEHAVEMVEEANLADGGVELTLDLPPDPLRLDGDATRLSQIFVNLISNAVRFTEPGGRVTVTARSDGSSGDQIVVKVRDTGIGITAGDLPDIFELFVQVDRSLARTKGGLGLGLSVARRLTELHGGTLEARSEGLGKGSEFIVSLPGLPTGDAGSLHESSSARPSDGEGNSRRRVLIVDDNKDSAEVLGILVGVWGHDVAMAHDGVTALEVAARHSPEVVLLDLGLPRLNGYEVARRIREDPALCGALLIAVSGYGKPEDHRRTKEVGFDHHLVKPVDPAVLESLLVSPRE